MPTAFEKVMDSRKELVDKIIKLMEEGYHHNQSLWSSKAIFPNNPESNVVYRGGNRLRLMIAAMENNFEDPRWMTFRQMAKAGYHLKEEHQSVFCEKWIFTEKKKQISENGKEQIVEVPLEKPKVAYFYVFNASQIEGYPKMEKRILSKDLDAIADAFIDSSECPVYELPRAKAFYQRKSDYICVPLRSMFKDGESFVGTLFHEMAHSTGHESRMNRTFGKKFGDPDYAKEELRAELSALFTSCDLGITPTQEVMEDHSDYLKSWIGALRDDPHELFRACSDAEQISQRIVNNYNKNLEEEEKLKQQEEQEHKKEEEKISERKRLVL